jgi:hypothetical protein
MTLRDDTAGAAVAAVQIPTLPGMVQEFGAGHAVVQHTPLTQNVEPHCAPTEQDSPMPIPLAVAVTVGVLVGVVVGVAVGVSVAVFVAVAVGVSVGVLVGVAAHRCLGP